MQLKNLSIDVLTTVIRYPIRQKEVVSRISVAHLTKVFKII